MGMTYKFPYKESLYPAVSFRAWPFNLLVTPASIEVAINIANDHR
jgi:hypothetical protein